MEYIYFIFIVGLVYWLISTVINKFDQVKKEAIRKEQERIKQKKIDDNIDKLIANLIADWNSSIYADKIETPSPVRLIYKFENGNRIVYEYRTLMFITSMQELTYKLGFEADIRFRNIFVRIRKAIIEGNVNHRSTYNRKNHSYSKTIEEDSKTRKYNIIMQTVISRREQLSKMSKTDPERSALENELRVAERTAAKLKKQL